MVKGGTLFPGYSLTFGDFGDLFDSGFQFGISIRFKVPNMENIDGDFTIGYATYQGETGDLVIENDYTIIPLTFNGILNLNAMAADMGGTNPFLLAGIGYYLLRKTETWSTEFVEADFGYRDNASGINVGGGVMYYINKNLFIEGYAKYHYILGEDGISLLDVRVGPGFYF